jgi:ankyrin repeat protein
MSAVLRQDFVAVNRLLMQGADPDYTDRAGQTPLMVATWKNQGGVIRLLLESGADINKQDPKGQTALIHAAFHGSEMPVRQLIKEGADLDKISDRGTALTCAVSGGLGYIAGLLIERGADVNIPDNEGRTALSLARRKGLNKIAEILKTTMLADSRLRLIENAKQHKLKVGPAP